MATDVLSLRALNRATLDRQLLLRRHDRGVLDTVEHLVGLQAQAPFPPYYGLWSRLDGFRPDDLGQLLLDRSVVRIALMRGTVHLVSARDCLALRELVQPLFDREIRANATWARPLDGVDLAAVADAARAVVERQPTPHGQVGVALQEQWPDVPANALAHAARGTLPMVQVPPRAVWGRRGQPTLTTAQAWLGEAGHRAFGVEEMVTRYLAAFGPASVRDAQVWSGIDGLGEVLDGMRGRLRVFRDEQGRELFDLPDAPRPDPDVPAPVRYVAEYDNLVLSHADRSRVISDADRKRLSTVNGVFPGTVLVDGFVHGIWRLVRAKESAELVVTPYRRMTKKHRDALTREGAELLDFAAPGDRHEVSFDAVAD